MIRFFLRSNKIFNFKFYRFCQRKKIEISKQEYQTIINSLKFNQDQSLNQSDGQFFQTQQQRISLKLLQLGSSDQIIAFMNQKKHSVQDVNILFLFIFTFCKYEQLSSKKIQKQYQRLVNSTDKLDTSALVKFYELIYIHKQKLSKIPQIPKIRVFLNDNKSLIQLILILIKLYPNDSQLLKWFQLIDESVAKQHPSIFFNVLFVSSQINENLKIKWNEIAQKILKQIDDNDSIAQILLSALQNDHLNLISNLLQKINLEEVQINQLISIYFNLILHPNIQINIRQKIQNVLLTNKIEDCSFDSYLLLWSILTKITNIQIRNKFIQILEEEQNFKNFQIEQINSQQCFGLLINMAFLNVDHSQILQKIEKMIQSKLNEYSLNQKFYIWKACKMLKLKGNLWLRVTDIINRNKNKLNEKLQNQFKLQ